MNPLLPETKHEIGHDELLAALQYGQITPRPWFYKTTREEIPHDKDIVHYSYGLRGEDESEFIILKEAKCITPEYTTLLLENTGTKAKRGFIFYKSILPEFTVQAGSTLSWLLIHSQIANITIESGSRVENLAFIQNSQAGDISIRDNSAVTFIEVENNSKAGTISLYNKGQCENINIEGNSQTEGLYFSEDSQAKTIQLNHNSRCKAIKAQKSKLGVIWIEDNSQSGHIGIQEVSQCEHIFVRDHSRTGPITIGYDGKISHISFEESTGTSIIIAEGVQCEAIKIRENSQVGNLQIRGGHVKDMLIENNYCSIHLLNATVPTMRVGRCHIHELKWEAGTRAELYITDSFINHLNLSNTVLAKDAVLSLANCSLHIIQLQELIMQGLLIFRNISVSKELFQWQPELNQLAEDTPDNKVYYELEQRYYKTYYENLEKLKASFPISPLFIIANSSLGKTEITGSNLELFRLEYRDSRMLEVFISGTKLPPINIYCPPDQPLPPRELFEQRAAIYNQLKRIRENQGDIIEAAKYHSLAMDSQKDLLRLVYRENHQLKWYSVNKWFTDEAFDLFNFRLNRLSNNHGESWRKALGFAIFLSLFFYTCYYTSLNYHKSFALTGNAIGDFIGNYFGFFDLTHKMDFMADKSQLNATTKFLDFIGRIAIGYSIYQLIVAFRRHGRK